MNNYFILLKMNIVILFVFAVSLKNITNVMVENGVEVYIQEKLVHYDTIDTLYRQVDGLIIIIEPLCYISRTKGCPFSIVILDRDIYVYEETFLCSNYDSGNNLADLRVYIGQLSQEDYIDFIRYLTNIMPPVDEISNNDCYGIKIHDASVRKSETCTFVFTMYVIGKYGGACIYRAVIKQNYSVELEQIFNILNKYLGKEYSIIL